jgi:hypothetical protein
MMAYNFQQIYYDRACHFFVRRNIYRSCRLVTPVGYFTGAKSLLWAWGSYRDYFAWYKCGISEQGIIFPKVTFTFDGI